MSIQYFIYAGGTNAKGCLNLIVCHITIFHRQFLHSINVFWPNNWFWIMVKNVKLSSAIVRWHLRTISVAKAQNINSTSRIIFSIFKLECIWLPSLEVLIYFIKTPTASDFFWKYIYEVSCRLICNLKTQEMLKAIISKLLREF